MIISMFEKFKVRRMTSKGVMFYASLVAAATIGLSGNAFAAGDGDEVIKFNYGRALGFYAEMYVAEELDLYKKYGLEPEFFTFQSGAPMLAGLKSKSLDVVTTGFASVFALGAGIPVKYLMWEGDAAQAEGLIVRKDLNIDSLDQLSQLGKIGVPTGTCAQISLFYAAKAAGVDYDKLSTVNIAAPLFANAFASKAIDAGVAWGPFAQGFELEGHKIIGYDPDWVPAGGACAEMTMIREAILESNPELAKRLIAVYAEAQNEMMRNPALPIRLLSERLTQPEEVIEKTYARYYTNMPTLEKQIDPKSRYSLVGEDGLLAQLRVAAETFAELGVISEPIPDEVLKNSLAPEYVESYLKQHPAE